MPPVHPSTKEGGRSSIFQTVQAITKEAPPQKGRPCSLLCSALRHLTRLARAAALRCLPACSLRVIIRRLHPSPLRAAGSLPLFAASFALCALFSLRVYLCTPAGLSCLPAAFLSAFHTGRPLSVCRAALASVPNEGRGRPLCLLSVLLRT